MRILSVHFKNLNSLQGEWRLDFTHPAYASDGIFAITGPTGAGKTTILDAICLGLYGRTPRLDKVTKSNNEILSRQSGECFSEVTFETQKGRYRCHWSQHRARKRPEGELQQAKHEIADAESGTILESSLTRVGECIGAVTGMDFGRFTRSMLLAQGGFAAFLQAPPDERAPILEQITGTRVYSLISMQVHQRRTAEREKCEWLQAEAKGIQVLGPDEERALQTDLATRQCREAETARQVDDWRKALLWRERITALEAETAELDKRLQENQRRRQAFAPEAKRLEAARKALGIEGDYRGVVALRAQQTGEIRELNDAVTRLPEVQKACADTLALKEAEATRLKAARDRRDVEDHVIKKVRDLDTRIGEQKKQGDTKDRAIAAAEKQRAAYQCRLADLQRELNKTLSDRDALQDRQRKHAADAALPAAIAVIGRGFAALRDLEGKKAAARAQCARADREKASAARACGKIEADHAILRRKRAEGQSALKGLIDETKGILKDRDILEWRQKTEALKDREHLLARLGEANAAMERNAQALAAAQKDLDAWEAARIGLLAGIHAAADHKAALEKASEEREKAVALMSRLRDLEAERQRLEDGKPCPLCGATDHPYAAGNLPEAGEAEGELKNIRAQLNGLSERLGTLQAEQARAAAGVDHAEREIRAKQAEREAAEKACAEALRRLHIDAAPEERTEKTGRALAEVRACMSEASGILAAAEAKLTLEKAAQSDLERLRVQCDSSERALQEARHRRDASGSEHARLIKECEAREEEHQRAYRAALRDLEPFGVVLPPAGDLEAILAGLNERKEAWQALQTEITACEKKGDELKAQIDKTGALLERIDKDLLERRRDRDDQARQGDSLLAERLRLYGEKQTDREEKRLAEAVIQAENAVEKARGAHGKVEKELGTLEEKILALKERTGHRTAELIREEQKLATRIRKAGFAREADYLSASLSEDERNGLADQENGLIREMTALGARRTDRWEALEAERGQRLTDLPRERLQERIETDEGALKEMRLQIGGIAKSLMENRMTKERRQALLKHRDAQVKECARWDSLQALIGSADGKKFRNFAQGLTFEMMIRHANRHLEKMTDRYLLIRDPFAPLELNVIDNYQAGEIRSTKNLSGGEGFLVSLALALGLSGMVSRNVRIDSLFLDEGFGTLDEDALETALETLAGLQQDGKLIGVISHVPALKERIATQIQVIPETGGRSRITGPGCRGID